ncbi:hypothetical protein [Elioraea sp.]|uniref:hypothetical protein n=1 Tax=Elioraea sp. TaxID=2185103 RepID=UPI0025C6B610|nr:hypothetical protein [Elioraea sp.]
MAWTLNNENMKAVGAMSKVEKDLFNDWARAVSNGEHPKSAAEGWDSDYESYKGAPTKMTIGGKKGSAVKCCSIRLSQGNRVYFVQAESQKMVIVLRVGDHKEPDWPKEIK